MNRDGILFQYSLATEGCGSGEVQEVSDLFVCRLLLHMRSLVEWSFYFCTKEVTTMYRPQYLEQKYEVITVQNGNGEIVRKYRRPIKSDTYKRKESNEVIPLYGKRIAKH